MSQLLRVVTRHLDSPLLLARSCRSISGSGTLAGAEGPHHACIARSCWLGVATPRLDRPVLLARSGDSTSGSPGPAGSERSRHIRSGHCCPGLTLSFRHLRHPLLVRCCAVLSERRVGRRLKVRRVAGPRRISSRMRRLSATRAGRLWRNFSRFSTLPPFLTPTVDERQGA
jgi:hypothetical protein